MTDKLGLKNSLQSLASDEFEGVVASVWSEMGWETELTPSSNDKGIDIIATKSGVYDEKVVIQAKCYSTGNKIGRPEVQQYNTLQQQVPDADSVIIVTSGEFTTEAIRLADKLGIKSVDGVDLAEACISNLPEDFLSDIIQREDSNLGSKSVSPDHADQNLRVEELSEPEQDLAKVFDIHFRRVSESSHDDADDHRRQVYFNIDTNDNETSEYVVVGTVHKIKFPAKSPKLLAQLQQTAEKYNWEVLYTDAYDIGPSGIELIVPISDGTMFYMAVDVNNSEKISPRRQARVSNLILDRVYEQDLSGMEVSEFGVGVEDDSIRRVIK